MYDRYIVMGDGKNKANEETRILKNMKEFLGNPNTCEEIYIALTSKLSHEEIFDLHAEERQEAYALNHDFYRNKGTHEEKMDQKNHYFKNTELFRHRSEVEKTLVKLWYYHELGKVDGMHLKDELDEQFKLQLKNCYKNAIIGLVDSMKKITHEDVDHIKYKVLERFTTVEIIETGSVTELINVLTRQLRSDDNDIARSLKVVGEIHGEDIARPILHTLGEDYTLQEGLLWPSVAIGFYCFGQIDYTQRKQYMTAYKDRTKETIMRTLQSSLPTVQRMMELSRKVQGTQDPTALVKVDEKQDTLVPSEIKIDTKSLVALEKKWDALDILLKAEDILVKNYLDKLKAIMQPDQQQDKLPETLIKLLEAGK